MTQMRKKNSLAKQHQPYPNHNCYQPRHLQHQPEQQQQLQKTFKTSDNIVKRKTEHYLLY